MSLWHLCSISWRRCSNAKMGSRQYHIPTRSKTTWNWRQCLHRIYHGKDGLISNVKVIKGFSHSINQEAKRLIESMPNWVGTANDCAAIRTRARIPISFILAWLNNVWLSEQVGSRLKYMNNKPLTAVNLFCYKLFY